MLERNHSNNNNYVVLNSKAFQGNKIASSGWPEKILNAKKSMQKIREIEIGQNERK